MVMDFRSVVFVDHHSIFIAAGSVVSVVMSGSGPGISAEASGASGSGDRLLPLRHPLLVLFCHQFGLFSLVSALILDNIPYRRFTRIKPNIFMALHAISRSTQGPLQPPPVSWRRVGVT